MATRPTTSDFGVINEVNLDDDDGVGSGGSCVANGANNSEIYRFHSGGFHSLYRDGSVRLNWSSMDYAVLTAPFTHAANETTLENPDG
ncbi:hypothetical protein K2X85_17265 [bacterium]|nr:hypothetical protein [bacterium]